MAHGPAKTTGASAATRYLQRMTAESGSGPDAGSSPYDLADGVVKTGLATHQEGRDPQENWAALRVLHGLLERTIHATQHDLMSPEERAAIAAYGSALTAAAGVNLEGGAR